MTSRTGLAAAMLLSACSGRGADPHAVDIANAASEAQNDIDNYSAIAAVDADAGTVPNPAPTPVPTPPAAPADGPAAAATVLGRYHAAIAGGRFGDAWALWDDDGKASGMSAEAFAASFAKYATYRATVGTPGAIEAGAGQRYVTVPVEVTGTLKADGTPFVLAGPMTLHRAGDIDGATPAQRSWRISTSGLRPRPNTSPLP